MLKVESVHEAQKMVKHIKEQVKHAKTTLVLGVDCEGISKESPLSLIQICVGKRVFVVDLYRVNPFILGLKEIMECAYIIKVFHDF
jgi:ribonuclease D